jgi:hypothetical protein
VLSNRRLHPGRPNAQRWCHQHGHHARGIEHGPGVLLERPSNTTARAGSSQESSSENSEPTTISGNDNSHTATRRRRIRGIEPRAEPGGSRGVARHGVNAHSRLPPVGPPRGADGFRSASRLGRRSPRFCFFAVSRSLERQIGPLDTFAADVLTTVEPPRAKTFFPRKRVCERLSAQPL